MHQITICDQEYKSIAVLNSRVRLSLVLLLLLLWVMCRSARTQTLGIVPDVPYDESSFDSVNLQQGTVILHIPILSYPQRGTLPPLGLMFLYNSPSWTSVTQAEQTSTPDGSYTTYYTYWTFIHPTGNGVEYTPNYQLTGQVANEGNQQYINFFILDSTQAIHALNGFWTPAGGYTGRYFTSDGSALSTPPRSPSVVFDKYGVSHLATDLPNVFPTATATFMQDPNGNTVTVSSQSGFIDSVGRHIPLLNNTTNGTSTCSSSSFPTFGGSTTPVSVCFQQLYASSNIGQASVAEAHNVPYVEASSITLQNGSQWNFTYDSWGNLSTVTTPTGAVISYTWSPPQGPVGTPYARQVTQRSINVDGIVSTWLYAYQYSTGPSGSTTTTVTDPQGNQIIHSFPYGTPNSPYVADDVKYVDATKGLEKEVVHKIYHSSSAQGWVIEARTATTTLADGSVSEQCTVYDNAPANPCSSTDTAVQTQFALYNAGQEMYSNQFGPPILVPISIGLPAYEYQFDYGAGQVGNLLGKKALHYVWETNASYLNAPLWGSLASSVEGNTSNQLSKSFIYDETNGSPQGVHGNLTTTNTSVGNGTTVSTHTVYNSQGMPSTIIDGNNNSTLIAYDQTGAYRASVTLPPTGSVAHVTLSSYDANTGLLASMSDESGNQTRFTYDSMRRPLTRLYPDGGSETFLYDDSVPSPSSQFSRALSSLSQAYSVTTIEDALGRPVQQQLKSAPEGAIYEDTTYDSLGHVAIQSTSYHAKNDPTYATSAASYDVLGRVTRLTHSADGSSTTASYTGRTEFDTDENGNQKSLIRDALGRTLSVTESADGRASFLTQYSYDGLSNLTQVLQRGTAGDVARLRSFQYDSLSRLTSAQNPETGITCYGHWTGTSCAEGYDGNGNLLHRTDARGVQTNYTYDALNRLVSKIYSNDQAGTFSSCYQYDSASNGVGLLGASWTLSGVCGQHLPVSGLQTSRKIVAYDPMGRATSEQKCSPGVCTTVSPNPYSFNYAYDLAGNLVQTNDGIGQATWTYSHDAAGRFSAATATTLWSPLLYPSQLISVQGYSPAGGLTNWTMGAATSGSAALTGTRVYDKRLRVSSESVVGHD